MDIAKIQRRLADFVAERDWERFQSPKNLAMALAGEAGELLEVFQWLSEEETRALRAGDPDHERAREEVADVLIYLLRLTDVLGIDLERAVKAKLATNEQKYPVALSRGHATKYNRL